MTAAAKDSIGFFDSSMKDFIRTTAMAFGEAFIVQEFIDGYEVEVPVFGLSEVVAPMACGISLENNRVLGERILDYDTIFNDEYTFYNFADEHEICADQCRNNAILVFEALSLSGVARIDFRVGPQGKAYVIDITNIPHLTKHGAPAFMFSKHGLSYSDLFNTLLSVGHTKIDKLDISPQFNRAK